MLLGQLDDCAAFRRLSFTFRLLLRFCMCIRDAPLPRTLFADPKRTLGNSLLLVFDCVNTGVDNWKKAHIVLLWMNLWRLKISKN